MNKKYNVFPKLIEYVDFRLTEMLAIQEVINNELQTNLTLDELFKMEKIV